MFASAVDSDDHHSVYNCLVGAGRDSRARNSSRCVGYDCALDLVVTRRARIQQRSISGDRYGGSRRHSVLRFASDRGRRSNESVSRKYDNAPGRPSCIRKSHRKNQSGPLVLSSLLDPTAGVPRLTNFRAEPISARQTIQRSPDLAGTKFYRLLDDRSAPGSFLYGYQANYLPSKQRLANNESFTHEVVQAPRPLFELEFGGWHLPVMLSGAAVSR